MSQDRRSHVSPGHLSRLKVVLEGHRGTARTIRAKDLAVILGIHDPTGRTIRECVNALIEEGVPVGSVNFEAGGGGYFIVTTEAELERCMRNYQSRARENLRKAERLTEAFRRGVKQPALLDVGQAR